MFNPRSSVSVQETISLEEIELRFRFRRGAAIDIFDPRSARDSGTSNYSLESSSRPDAWIIRVAPRLKSAERIVSKNANGMLIAAIDR